MINDRLSSGWTTLYDEIAEGVYGWVGVFWDFEDSY